jgi:hypothetical protein
LAKARLLLLQFSLPCNALPLNGRLNGALDSHPIDLLRCTPALEVLDLPLQLGEPLARLIEAADFVFRLLWQVRKLTQHSANRPRRRWRCQ